MTAADSNKIEDKFIEAKNNWDLEKLYVDLASAKGKALTPVEKKFLRGLLCGFSPAEIANTVYQSRSSSTVRVYLSNGLYKYIEEMLSNQAGDSIKVKSWSRVTHLLEAGYKKAGNQLLGSNQIKINKKETEDWGEAIDVSVFHGRTTELAQIKEWIVEERCRLVVLLGMEGIGKTALSVKLAEQIKDKFEYVIWRSLRLAPPPALFLNQLIQLLSQTQQTKSEYVESSVSQIIDCLRSSRCLIVLDDVDSILCTDITNSPEVPRVESLQADLTHHLVSTSPTTEDIFSYVIPQIQYCRGYEIYGELIRRVGESLHQSCLVLTSRAKPQEIVALEGKTLPVRCLKLTGLSNADSREILNAKGFADSKDEECRQLIEWYAGNPLFIKLVATAIQELFGGRIYEFLEQGTMVFGNIRAILDQQFNRLSSLEKLIMYWLALNRSSISVRKLQKDIVPRVPQRLILEAIDLLQRRSLIERQASSFSPTLVLMEYIAERLIEENFKLIEQTSSLLMSHTVFFEAQLKNYIREMRLNPEI